MGFKLVPQVTTPKPTIMLNKAPKTVKIVPQVGNLLQQQSRCLSNLLQVNKN